MAIIKSLLLTDSTPSCVLELVATEVSDFLKTDNMASHSADKEILRSRLGGRSTLQSIQLGVDSIHDALAGFGNLRLALQAAHRICGPMNALRALADLEPVLFSVLVCIVPDRGARPLVHTLVEDYIPQTLQATGGGANAELADRTALVLSRYQAQTGIDLSMGKESEFWDRVRSWTAFTKYKAKNVV